MKIQMQRDVSVEVYNPRLEETFDRQLKKWDTIVVETMEPLGKTSDLAVYGDLIYLGVPTDSFRQV